MQTQAIRSPGSHRSQRSLRSTQRQQKGAYLVIASVLMVVLVAFGALSLDLGRIFVLRTEMQNAADAAALAAARELGGTAGSRARATAAARFTVEHDGRFADVQELLGANLGIEYYCAIGSQFDPAAAVLPGFCSGSLVDGRYEATSDADARYARVNLIPSEDDNTYALQLMFLPVLNLFINDVDTSSTLQTSATAGRSFFQCDYPPVMICNPFESDGDSFESVMLEGEQAELVGGGGSSWVSGNFGFLQNSGQGGATQTQLFLADEELTGCTPAIFTTETGAMSNPIRAAINTRFDLYEPPNPFNQGDAPDNWPPAPNVIDYPRDQTWSATNPRFGTGDWDRDTYFTIYHDWQGHGRPGDWANLTRWEVYNWELNEDKLPSQSPLVPGETDTEYDGIPDPDHIYEGDYPPPRSFPERRLINVAVVNCAAQGLNGSMTFTMFGEEGFARMFITEAVDSPPNVSIFAEYVEWSTPASDGNQFIDVQLYE